MQKELRKYWNKENFSYSCSETMLLAGNEFYNLGLDVEAATKMMAPFSGGMFEGETCGVITGGIAVLGLILTNNNKADSPKMIEATKEYKQRFLAEIGNKNCNPLKDEYEDQPEGCGSLIYKGGKILEEVIAKYNK